MYTEGFEEFDRLEETGNEARRTYVSGNSREEVDRLMRENERLRKSIEKEKFFNKLLDQEIQELKANNPSEPHQTSDYWSRNRRVSKSAFYTLLVITLAMAAYIGYGIYYDKQFNYIGASKSSRPEPVVVEEQKNNVVPPATRETVPLNNTQTNTPAPAQQSTSANNNVIVPPATPAVIRDSVPNIIGANKPEVKESKKAEVVASTDEEEEYNEEEVNAILNERTTPLRVPPPTSPENKPVIGRYRINTKANFYNSPDENTMRNTFISEAPNRIVEARDDKNGFVFVVYTNDLGFTSKGWLSKKDLTKGD